MKPEELEQIPAFTTFLETWARHCGTPRSVFVGQLAVAVGKAFNAEREEWNKMFGIKRPDGSPPLSPKDARLMKAIFEDE